MQNPIRKTSARPRRSARPSYALWAAAGTLAILLFATRWSGFAPSDPQTTTIAVEGQT